MAMEVSVRTFVLERTGALRTLTLGSDIKNTLLFAA